MAGGAGARVLLVLIGMVPVTGCGSEPVSAPEGTVPVVTIADLHFNPLYDASLYGALAAADPDQWAGIYRGSAVKAVASAGSDANYPLLALTLASVQQSMAGSPVVICTGDLLGHNIPRLFFTGYYGTANYPTPDAAAIAAMEKFVDKSMAFVAGQIRAAAGSVPVIYAPGNIDTYGPGFGPEPSFLAANADTVYSRLLMASTDQATFLSTFTLDGYYTVQPLGSKLRTIVLNTNSFVAGAPSAPRAAAELAWLETQLAAAENGGQRVWIVMHVPPGANTQAIVQKAPLPSDVDDSTASMMWDAGLQARFMETLGRHRGRVTLMLAGHTHMDEFRILPTGDVLEQLPGISPCFGNNPAYKVLTVALDTFTPVDYTSLDYDLATRPSGFGTLYQFSAAYGSVAAPGLGPSLARLYAQMEREESTRDLYRLLYASGTTSDNAVTMAPWNPINGVNWPIFGCAIGKTDQADYVGCVTGR